MKFASKNILVLTILTTVIFSGCASENKNTAAGAGIGAAAGAVAGAIIGHQTGNRERGAMAGAILGGAAGGVVGHRMDKQAKELEAIAETKRTETGLVTKLKSDILFDTGKANLKTTAKSNLKQMAEIMKKYPENILTIKGYTDSTGSMSVNKSLSKNRADSVKSQLIEAGMPSEVISTVGEGPDQPVGDNKTVVGRQQNRRVEVEVTVDESKVPKTKK